ncbi:mitochondrial outer membrane protein porin 2-like protein, partial [Tanacetum coccineum]
MDDGMMLKSLRADDKNLDARIYVVDGKPLKSILKKPKESKTNTSGSQQHLWAGSAMEDPEKAVRRKVVIALDESNTEYDEIDVSSSKSTRAMETETCNKPPQVVIESTKNDDSSMDNLVTHHTDPTCEVHTDENQISKPTSVESDANDVNRSSPQMKTGSYASVVNDHDQVNSTTNDGCKFESKGTKRVNFRSLVSEEQVDNSDTVLPMAAMEKVKNRVLERGLRIIRNTPLILNRWTPNVYLKKDEVTKVPVWVKLHNVPVVSYSADGLSLIATQVGKPFMLDAFTSSMCDDSWGRINYALALVEISAEYVLKHE